LEKTVFIINPIAGSRKQRDIKEKILKLTNHSFPETCFFETGKQGEATIIVKEKVKEGIKRFVAVGGDGTVNEVAQGLVNTKAAVGIIPTGSGNGLARHLGIPLNLPGAIDFLRNARPLAVDYGILNGTPFFCTAGIGFDALIGHEFSLAGKRGFFSYLRLILARFISYTPQEYKIRINGSEITKVLFLITFANSSQYGNRASIAPQASIKDGFMDVSMLSPFPFYRAFDIGIQLLTKTIDSCNYIEIVKCKEVSVERESPGLVHFDGEPKITGRIVDVKIIPGGLNVLIRNTTTPEKRGSLEFDKIYYS